MAARSKHREAILSAAVQLFRRQGYAATGLAEILEASGAPKGSLYHYFPGGKVEIGEKAVERAGETVAATLRDLVSETGDAGEVVERYARLLGGWLEQSGFRDGSPLTTIILETVPQHEPIRLAAMAAYASWAGIIKEAAQAGSVAPDRAGALATLTISVIDGALIQCRVEESSAPLERAANVLKQMFHAARS